MNPDNDPNYLAPAAGFRFDPKALMVAGIAMGITLLCWAALYVLGGTGWIIMLLLMAGGGGYVFYRGRNPEAARSLEVRVQQLTRNAAGQVSAAAHTSSAAPPASAVGGAPASQSPQRRAQFPDWRVPPQAAVTSTATAALISAALLIPSLIAYGWRYESANFTDMWQPWWILTGLNLYYVCCVVARARAGRGRLAGLLALAGTVLIGLANNPSGEVNLTAMFSSKRYYGGISYSVPPSPDVLVWIYRTPTLAILLFVAAWGIARRQRPGWVFGLIPAGLLVWWSIYGAEHGFAAKGGWFSFWLMSVGAFLGGCICCWLADLFTSAGGGTSVTPRYGPPGRSGLPGSPDTAPRPLTGGQVPAHADYRAQASRHFQDSPPNPSAGNYEPPGGHSPPR